MGDLAEKKIEWVANGPDAAAGQGQDKVEAQFSPLEKELEEGKPARKRISGDLLPAKAETPTREGKTRKEKKRWAKSAKEKVSGGDSFGRGHADTPTDTSQSEEFDQWLSSDTGDKKGKRKKKRRRTSLQTADHSGQAPESSTEV